MKDPITLLVMFKDGHKTAEMDITDTGDKELARVILAQDDMGRKWEYQFTSKQKMKEGRENYGIPCNCRI